MRRLGRCRLAALLCAALALPAAHADEGRQGAMPCPGAIAWNQAHPDELDAAIARRDAARTFTEPALRAELAERTAQDQKARIAWLADRSDWRTGRAVGQIDADNLAWLRRLVRDHGFPTAVQVGERGVLDAWLLAQHADRDPAFQAALLPVLEQRQRDGDLRASDLARFTDRVLVAHGQPQRYGTQFSPEAWATLHFGLPDEESVRRIDANRRELGVMPLAEYVCMMSHARKGRP